MSQEMVVVETENREWFYILEDKGAPKDSWDWREYATAYGPFPDIEKALEHEYDSDSDTSGYEIIGYGVKPLDKTDLDLIAKATANAPRMRR